MKLMGWSWEKKSEYRELKRREKNWLHEVDEFELKQLKETEADK